MRAVGVLLVVLAAAAVVFLAVFRSPSPEWLCGGTPSAIVAIGFDDRTEPLCVDSARWHVVQAVAAGLGLGLVGLVCIVDGNDEDKQRRQITASFVGARSPDGAWWWDGDQWRPMPPPSPPPPPG